MNILRPFADERMRKVLLLVMFFIGVIGFKLFYMQVLAHGHYLDLAKQGRQGYRELTARRGEIYINDFHSGEDFRLATNITLDTVFADPYLLEDPELVANKIAPILFDEEEAQEVEEERLEDERKKLPVDISEEELEKVLVRKSVAELKKEYRDQIYEKIANKIREQILLVPTPNVPLKRAVRSLGLSGVEVTDDGIYAYPALIESKKEYATKLSRFVEIPVERLEAVLAGKNRYVVLKKKVRPEVSEKLKNLKRQLNKQFAGIGFEEETYRYYPEEQLAAPILGFTDIDRTGVYGLEKEYEKELKGKSGVFKTELDGAGRQITVGSDVVIEQAQDGSDLYLTLDRSIQKQVEKYLADAVINTRSDSGQVIIMDPKTGAVMAMANYPTFDPNVYWEALETEEVVLDEEQQKRIVKKTVGKELETYLITNDYTEDKIRLFDLDQDEPETEDDDEQDEDGDDQDLDEVAVKYAKFVNDVGAAAYRNRVVADIYEPGSVFKVIAMAIGLDAAGLTPDRQINDFGPIKVDEFTIDNALGKHYGLITMTQVLETSNNIGMAFVAKEIGRSLFGSYLKKFGFGRETAIELPDQGKGQIETSQRWSEAELVTHGFGQGISVTPMQMITALAALANDGVMMRPYLIDKIENSERSITTEPRVVRQVITKETADKIKAMMVSVVENGQQRKTLGGLPYTIAGKTGTSQTYKRGIPLEGAGTTIATYGGFAPAEDPKFVVLVKLDKPKTSQWADATAVPLFKQVAEFMFDYLAIPPDKI